MEETTKYSSYDFYVISDSSMPEVGDGKEKLAGPDVTSGENEATTDVENTQIEKTKRKSETAFSGFAMPSSTVKPVKTSKTSEPSQKDDGTRARSKGVGELLRKATDKAETVSEETFKQPGSKAAEKEKNLPEVVSKVITKRYEYCVIIFYA